jgi:predicted MFS family arabinose efflux permease
LSSTPRQHVTAVAAIFFANGFTFSNFLPRLPEIRDQLDVGNDSLGIALIGAGLGGLVGSFILPIAIGRFGSKRLLSAVAPVLALLIPLVAYAPTIPALLGVLVLLGVLDVNNDLAMNTQGVLAQDRLGKPIMNRLHGLWSVGFTAGALVALGARAADIAIKPHLIGVCAATFFVVLWALRAMVHDRPDAPTSRPGIPRSVVMVALLALGTAMTEVVPIDWSAINLQDAFDAGKWSGIGSVTFSGAMLVGRLLGDHALMKFGQNRLLLGSFTLTGIGAVIVSIAPAIALAIVGFAIWGFGASVLFPQLYERAARTPNAPAGAGLAAMSIGQRFGFMITGPIVGWSSEQFGIRWAFAGVMTGALLLVGLTLRRPSRVAVA